MRPRRYKKSRPFGPSAARLRLLNELLESNGLSEVLPYRCFDPETQLFHNLGGKGFVIETLPLVGCKEGMPKQLTGLFQHLLPLGSNLQCLLIASPRIRDWLEVWEGARRNRSVVFQELAKERCAYLKELSKGQGIRTFRLLISYSEGTSVGSDINALLALREQLVTTLQGWGLPTRIWDGEGLIQGLDELLNPEKCEPAFPLNWNPHDSLSNQLMSPDTHLYVDTSQLAFGNLVTRLYTPRVFPNMWHLSAMNLLIGDPFDDFLRLSCNFFISYSVHICAEKTQKARLLAKCSNVEKQAASPVAKYVPSIKYDAQESRYFREKSEEGQRLVRTRYQVGLVCDADKIAREEQTLFNLYRSQRWELARDEYLQLPSFLSCLPMNWGAGTASDSQKFRKTKTTLSHEPANLLPLQGEWYGTKSPGMLLAGRRGQLFYWSPFDNNEGNYNTVVVGRSGSGKSVFMQELMTSMLGMGGRVFVLDVGRSFEKTAKLLGGTYVEFSTHTKKTPEGKELTDTPSTGGICINPFTSIPSSDPEATSDALAMLKPILSLMAAPKEGTKDLEDAYLEQAIQDAWKKKKNDATITDVAAYLLDHPKKDPIAVSLGDRLGPYTKEGAYARFFDGPANIDLSDNLVVVELEELKERKDLQAVIVQMVILQITNSVYGGDRKTPSCLILDEAWDMLRGKQSGVFIETAARRLRKYYGGLVVGTQSINDFYATPGAQAAFDNADWMCLLSQKDESIELLKNSKRLVMDPAMERTLRSLRTEQGKYAEIMIKGPKGFAVGRLFLDDFSKILYSTKAEEFTAVQSLVAQGIPLKEAIRRVAGGVR